MRHIMIEEVPQGSSSSLSNHADMPFQFAKVNHFKHLSASDRTEDQEHAFTSTATSDDNSWKNVIQVDEQYWISSRSICNMSFVFTDEDIQSGVFDDCRGIYNFFVVKHRIAKDGCVTIAPRHACPPFAGCMDGFSELYCMDQCKVIFNSIRQIRQDIQRILRRVAQSQGDFATHKLKLQLPSCSWFFIKNTMALHGIESISSIKYSQPRPMLSWGLCYNSLRHTGSLDVLRFDTQSKMAAFREQFGHTCGYGVRKKRPRYSEGRSLLNFNDVINVIACTQSYEQRETDFNTTTSENWQSFQHIAGRMRDGIDLAYDADDGVLQVVIRYRKMVVVRDESTFDSLKHIGVASPETGLHIGTTTTTIPDLLSEIIPGMEFLDQSFVMRVISVTDREIHARKAYKVLCDLTTVRAMDSTIAIYTDILAYVKDQIAEMLN
jgi:hypothetical protein